MTAIGRVHALFRYVRVQARALAASRRSDGASRQTDQVTAPNDPPLPSLEVISDQVASERKTMDSHAESLDAKAGVVLGFAGVLVGLGATAQALVSSGLVFQIGLGFAVGAALTAALAFLPRRVPVLEVLPMRRLLTTTEETTKLTLLDAQIKMVLQTATLVKHKGRRVKVAVALLAIAAGLVVAGTLITTGGTHA
jgi:hypothetical protein